MAIMAFAQVIVKATTPPACLIGAIGAQPSPADFKVVCGNLQQQVISKITEKCTNATMYSAAMSAYAATCLSEASIKVGGGIPRSSFLKSLESLTNYTEMKNDTDSKLRSTTVASDKKSPATPVPKSDSTQSPGTVAEQPSKPPSSIANYNNPSTAIKLLTFGTIARIFL
ncbi:hypothetical protein GcM3_005037 [Golovinomyces cichoracearum]|uniref:Gpi anchored cell wall protein n=1 Tax=Golovinomyces cichoracearum TaxID=62708 RepID=A0A420JB18_9PEZI|nr:hypothetical protein GcM3_005037 [Golovinomyces cichoracearum]